MPEKEYNNLLIEILSFLYANFSDDKMVSILKELKIICETKIDDKLVYTELFYENIQNKLSSFNEIKNTRKSIGAYYTPVDIIDFMISNSLEQIYSKNKIKSTISLVSRLNQNEINDFVLNKTIYDPSCGNGEFLLRAFEKKIKFCDECNWLDVIKTIFGNDIDKTAVFITKIRLFLAFLHFGRGRNLEGIGKILNSNITNYDFFDIKETKKYDIIIGNPPYVEFSKAEPKPKENLGNIYANFLLNSSYLLNNDGVMAFIIPISYVSTARMSRLRNTINSSLKTQFISSFADRPDCLFSKVHQKLNIFIGKRENKENLDIFTSSYQYWYKNERKELFKNIEIIKNDFVENNFIPKLGNEIELDIYKKILRNELNLNNFLSSFSSNSVFLGMRACFWIKAFLTKQKSNEYKELKCYNKESQFLLYCLLNSSLFWFFWTCVSDCWHITNKELELFRIPKNITKDNYKFCEIYAKNLIEKLEITKKFIGSKQADYEYKHKACLDEISKIDDLMADLYGLSKKENSYIKNFAIKYRTGGDILCIA